MFDVIADFLAWMYDLTSSYGVAIVLLTIAVNVVTTPFTLKSTKSMLAMQRLQPELKRIQTDFKHDRQRMNEELMAFYKEHEINPLGGCLPMLIQLPVFAVLYRVLSGLTQRFTEVGLAIGQVSSQASAGEPLREVSFPRQDFNPAYVDPGQRLHQDLVGANEMDSFGFDLSRSLSQMLTENRTKALPYLGLILLVFLTSRYQQRQISGRNTNAAVNPQQQMIMKVIPYMIPVISYGLPAAMVVYFLTGNLFRIGQQGYITRKFYHDRPGAIEALPSGTSRVDSSSPVTAAVSPRKASSSGRVTPSSRPGRASDTPSTKETSARRPGARHGGSSSDLARQRRTSAGADAPPSGRAGSDGNDKRRK